MSCQTRHLVWGMGSAYSSVVVHQYSHQAVFRAVHCSITWDTYQHQVENRVQYSSLSATIRFTFIFFNSIQFNEFSLMKLNWTKMWSFWSGKKNKISISAAFGIHPIGCRMCCYLQHEIISCIYWSTWETVMYLKWASFVKHENVPSVFTDIKYCTFSNKHPHYSNIGCIIKAFYFIMMICNL